MLIQLYHNEMKGLEVQKNIANKWLIDCELSLSCLEDHNDINLLTDSEMGDITTLLNSKLHLHIKSKAIDKILKIFKNEIDELYIRFQNLSIILIYNVIDNGYESNLVRPLKTFYLNAIICDKHRQRQNNDDLINDIMTIMKLNINAIFELEKFLSSNKDMSGNVILKVIHELIRNDNILTEKHLKYSLNIKY